MDYIDNSVYLKLLECRQVNALHVFVLALVLCELFEIHIKQCTGYQIMTVCNYIKFNNITK